MAAGLLSLALLPAVGLGVVVMLIVILLNIRYGVVLQKVFMERMEVRFPTPKV